jgi:hypothetical protein
VCGGLHIHHTMEHFVSDCRPMFSAIHDRKNSFLVLFRFRQVQVRSIFVNVFNCLWLHNKTGFDETTPVLTHHQPTRKQSVKSRQAVTTVLFTFLSRPGMGGRVTLQGRSFFLLSLHLFTCSRNKVVQTIRIRVVAFTSMFADSFNTKPRKRYGHTFEWGESRAKGR